MAPSPVGNLYRAAESHEKEVARYRQEAAMALQELDLESEAAMDRLAKAKPPR